MKRSFLTLAACFALLLSLPACDGDGSDPDDVPSATASFQATVTGAVSDDMSGTAFSGGPGDGTGWGVVMGVVSIPKNGGSGVNGSISIVRNQGDRPGEGTFSIYDPESQQENQFYAVAIIDGGVYSGTSGNLRITSSGDSNVRGTFSFTGTGGAGGTSSVTVEGGFNATNFSYFPD